MVVYPPEQPQVAQVSASIADVGSLIGGLTLWAGIAGYLSQYAFLATFQAAWAVGQLSSAQFLASGTECLIAISILVVIMIYVQRKRGAQHADQQTSLTVVGLAIGLIGVLAATLFLVSISPALGAIVLLGSIAFASAAVLSHLIIWGSHQARHSPSYKLLLIGFAILISSPYAALCGYATAKVTGNPRYLSAALIDDSVPSTPWLIITTLSDDVLVMQEGPSGNRTFRVEHTSDLKKICSPTKKSRAAEKDVPREC